MMTRETWLILALAVLVAIGGGWLQHMAAAGHGNVANRLLAEPLPAMTLHDLDGRPQPLARYTGHRVIVNLWAPWCGPCREEIPALNRAQARYGRNHPAIVSIAMDSPEAVRAYLADHPVRFPVLLGDMNPPDSATRLGDKSGILPYSLLVDADGTIRRVHRGRLDAAALDDWLGD